MSLLRSMAVGIVLLTLGIGSAQAVFIDSGTYLSDTDSGLDWLDVTASVNRSYSDVSTQFGAGGDFYGWRYATIAEFGAMVNAYTSYDLPITGPSQYVIAPEANNELRNLIALFGDTLDSFYQANYSASFCVINPTSCQAGDVRYTQGILGDLNPGTINPVMGEIWDDDRTTAHEDRVQTIGSAHPNAFAYYFGSYLVRQTTAVPEPASIALMGLGLAGLGFSRRRKPKGLSA